MFSQIGKRMLLWVLTLVIVPLGTVSLVTYYQARQALIEQIYTTLNVTADSLRGELVSFLESKKNRIREVSTYRFLRDILRQIQQQPGREDLIAELNQYLAKEKAPLDPDIYDILIFNKVGEIAGSTHETLKGIKIDREYFSQGREGITFKSIEKIGDERLFSVSAPIVDTERGGFLGVATVRFKASAIDTILTDEVKILWGARTDLKDLDKWGRIYIVDQGKTVIVDSSNLFLGRVVDIEPVNRAFGSKLEMTGEFVGILGKGRLGASLFLEEPRWVVVVSVPKDEALSPVLKFVYIGFLRISIGVIAVMILSLVIARRIARPILNIADTAERIAKGHWDERVVVKYKKGEIARLANAFNEMVETLQRSFRALRHSERLNENIVATLPSGVIILNKAFEVLSANKSFCEMFGITLHEVVGKPIDDVLREIGLSKEGRNVIAHKECFSKLEFECNSPEKGRLILNVSMTNMEDVEEVILVIEDITEHKQVAEVLRESEERYRSLFEESRDAIYITTREGKFVDLNQSALDLFGYTIEEMKRLYAHELYVNPSDRNKFQQEIEQKGFVRDYGVKLRKKDGTEIDCLITSTVRKATDGSILGYQGIIRAIAEGKKEGSYRG